MRFGHTRDVQLAVYKNNKTWYNILVNAARHRRTPLAKHFDKLSSKEFNMVSDMITATIGAVADELEKQGVCVRCFYCLVEQVAHKMAEDYEDDGAEEGVHGPH